MKIIEYTANLKVANVDQLPRGTGCKFLLAIEGIAAGEYVAKRWLRKLPKATEPGEVIIRFNPQ